VGLPLTNLVASYEPRLWGYSDGQVIDVTHPFKNDQGDNTKDLTTLAGSPTYKTGICCGTQAIVRFDGASSCSRVGGWVPLGINTICAVVIPRAFGIGYVTAMPVLDTQIPTADHQSRGGISIGASRWRGHEYVDADTTATFIDGTTITLGKAYAVMIEENVTNFNTMKLTVGGLVFSPYSGVITVDITRFKSEFWVGAQGRTSQFYGTFDLAALFLYGTALLPQTDKNDLLAYITTNYPCIEGGAVENAELVPINYTQDFSGTHVTLNGQVEDRFPLLAPCSAR
jgi:hypothetical protein